MRVLLTFNYVISLGRLSLKNLHALVLVEGDCSCETAIHSEATSFMTTAVRSEELVVYYAGVSHTYTIYAASSANKTFYSQECFKGYA